MMAGSQGSDWGQAERRSSPVAGWGINAEGRQVQHPDPDVTHRVERPAMPAPDLSGVTIEEKPNGGWSVQYEMFMLSGRSQRKARVRRIMANLRLVLPVVR